LVTGNPNVWLVNPSPVNRSALVQSLPNEDRR
jgi:hypothetical protein